MFRIQTVKLATRYLVLIPFILGLVACGGGGGGGATTNTVPADPAGLNAVTTSSGSIDIMWQDNADNEDAYILERSEVSSASGFSVVATLPADTQSYSDTGLTPATTYYYRVAASNTEGQSAYTSVVNAMTDAAPVTVPAAPSGLNGSATSSTSVDLFWIDKSDNESSFDIYQATDPGGPFTLAQTVSVNVENTTIGGLSPATPYSFKVIAVNAVGPSVDSNIHQITTPAAPQTSPTAPSSLTVGSATSSSLTLNWSDNSSNETGFRIYRSSSQFGTYSQIAAPSASSYTNTGLSASNTYWYKVAAYNGAGTSAQTTAVSGTTLAPPVTVPVAPSALTVGSATSSSLTLNWSDNSNNETGFRIYRSSSQFGTYSQIATASGSSYTNTGLSASSTYWYKVAAYNAAGTSAQTLAAFGTTQSPPVTVPAAPSNPTISNITSNSATLNWTDNSGNETGFQVGFCTGIVSLGSNGVRRCVSGFTQIDQVGANVTSYTFTGLSADTQYSRFVRAYNTAGNTVNTGRSFTTALGQQTVTLLATASNVVISNSLDSSVANTAYSNSFPAVGKNSYFSILGFFPDTLAFAGLVNYDVSSLLGRTIVSATLNLEVETAPVGFLPQNFNIGTVFTSWNPSTVTWNNVVGFQYYDAGWNMNIAYPTFAGQTYSIDFTAIVQNWADVFFVNSGLGFFSSNYLASPGNNSSLDAYQFYVPTLTVTYQ